MSVHEPMTLATDVLLSAFAAAFAIRLWRGHRMWALAFVFTAAGALTGGAYHGFAHAMTPSAAAAVWKATVLSIGLASFYLLLATSRRLAILATIKLIVYASWMIAHDDFIWVIADYGFSMLVLAAFQIAAWMRGRAPGARWILGSILVSAAGAGIQAMRVAPHPQFNHNDLYHVIQIVALWLLYRGARLTTSATDRATTRPR